MSKMVVLAACMLCGGVAGAGAQVATPGWVVEAGSAAAFEEGHAPAPTPDLLAGAAIGLNGDGQVEISVPVKGLLDMGGTGPQRAGMPAADRAAATHPGW